MVIRSARRAGSVNQRKDFILAALRRPLKRGDFAFQRLGGLFLCLCLDPVAVFPKPFPNEANQNANDNRAQNNHE
jgi:hypothetical protein